MVIDTSDGRSIQIVNEPLADGGWVATHEDVTERRRTEERITHLAHYDALTDLPNRAMFHEHLRRSSLAIADGEAARGASTSTSTSSRASTTRSAISIGDELLKSVAHEPQRLRRRRRLRGAARRRRIRHRPERGDDRWTQVNELVARVFEAIRAPFDCMGHHLTTDASIGIALAPRARHRRWTRS